MASRWINAILWTLVSVNLITLVLGGLVTWLGYAIPIRLRQFGLSPEITQLAGFASLLVACLGLTGLNYSSHYALNAYGLSCAIFIILMLFGVLPDHWQRFIYSPSQAVIAGNQQQQQHQQQQQSSVNDSISAPTQRIRPDHHPQGAFLVLDLLYIVLLAVLSMLVALAFILAQHLRRRELESDDELVADCYDHQGLESSSRHNSGGGGSGLMTAAASRRLLLAMQPDDMPDWSCATCNGHGSGGGINMLAGHNGGGQGFAATMSSPVNMDVVANKVSVGPQNEDKVRYTPRTISGGVNLPHQMLRHNANVNNNDQADSIRWQRLQSTTLDRPSQRSANDTSCHQSGCLATSKHRLDENNGHQLGANAHRLSSKSLANLAREDGDDDEDDDVIDNHGRQEDGLFEELASAKDVLNPLVQKGIYYADSCRLPNGTVDDLVMMKPARNDRIATEHATYAASLGKRQQTRQRKYDTNHDYHNLRYRTKTQENRCCCSDLPIRHSNKAATTLAAKLNPATSYNQALLDNYFQPNNHLQNQHHYHRQGRACSNMRLARNANTMPNKLNLSSVYAIRSLATSGPNRAFDVALKSQKQSKMSSGSVMAMTASAAAALLGGMSLDPGTFNHDHAGGLANGSNMDDGHDYVDPFIDHQDESHMFDGGTLFGGTSVPNSSNHIDSEPLN